MYVNHANGGREVSGEGSAKFTFPTSPAEPSAQVEAGLTQVERLTFPLMLVYASSIAEGSKDTREKGTQNITLHLNMT